MKVLFLSAEVAPYVAVGGLSQVMYFLPRSLQSLGHDVRIFTPAYGGMEKTAPSKKGWNLQIEVDTLLVPADASRKQMLQCRVSSFLAGGKYVPTYFLENREYFKLRANVFGYQDDHIRFSLLSLGCLEWLKNVHQQKLHAKETWWPDIIHCNDWHTGYFIELARTKEPYKKLLAKIPIILTVHNFFYQGNYDFRYHGKDRDTGKEPLEPIFSEKLQKQNALLRGLIYADAISTVSPTHAIEVLTSEYAEGLDSELLAVRGKLTGILNGLDTKEFNPATDPIIQKQFTKTTFIRDRKENKKNLQKEFLLPIDETKPIISISGRLTQQKGWDMILEILPHLLDERPDVQFVVLGSGDDRYREKLLKLKEIFPKQIGLHLRSDFRLPRKLFAGSDMVLLPSLFEPGGIVALEALRYGAVPIVRRTGGLSDIVEDFNPNTLKGNGFSFTKKDPWSLYGAIIAALTTYVQKAVWNRLVRNCLECDFSWAKAAKHYDLWYYRVNEERKRATSPTPHPAYGSSITLSVSDLV